MSRQPAHHDVLLEVLGESQDLGFIGARPVAEHVTHAEGFASAWAAATSCSAEGVGLGEGFVGRALDLGSGGGLPGLVLASLWPQSRWTFLDANLRRTTFLTDAVQRLDLAERCRVLRARAEEIGRRLDERATYDLVTARGFAAPAATAECAAPLLRLGGLLVVSEPPEDVESSTRWQASGLAVVGLVDVGVHGEGARYRVLRADDLCPDRYPRRVGVPEKRPLF